MPKSKEEGWKTIKGNHVLIGSDGTIQKGPKSITGKKVSELSSKSSSSKSSSSGKKSSSSKKSSSKSTSSSAKKSTSSGTKSSDTKSTTTKSASKKKGSVVSSSHITTGEHKKVVDAITGLKEGEALSFTHTYERNTGYNFSNSRGTQRTDLGTIFLKNGKYVHEYKEHAWDAKPRTSTFKSAETAADHTRYNRRDGGTIDVSYVERPTRKKK